MRRAGRLPAERPGPAAGRRGQRRHGRMDRALRVRLEPVGRPAPPRQLRRRASPAGQRPPGRRRWRGARNVALRSRQTRSHPSRRGAHGRCGAQPWRRRSPLRTRPTAPAGRHTRRAAALGEPLRHFRATRCRAAADRARRRAESGRGRRACRALRDGGIPGASASPGGAGSARQRRGKVRRGAGVGLPAGGRVAAVRRGAARGRPGNRRAHRSADQPEARGPHAALLGHEQGQVSRPARRAGVGLAPALVGQHRRVERAVRRPRAADGEYRRLPRGVGPQRFHAVADRAGGAGAGGRARGFAVAGTAACRKCHEGDYQAWRKSPHAAAWKSLQAKGAHVDPECQRCHTTGYGLPGGFASARRSATRAEVGCESCHGPSQGHVADPAVRTTHFTQAKNYCTGCHDHENSPTFAYDKYWHKIAHGEQPARKIDGSVPVLPSKDNP